MCQYLHLCPATNSVEPVSHVEPLREDPKCTICVYLVNAIDEAIDDPSDVEKVICRPIFLPISYYHLYHLIYLVFWFSYTMFICVFQVKTFLDGMCAHIPSEKMKQECTSFVNTYTAMILDLIAHGAQPKDVCVTMY